MEEVLFESETDESRAAVADYLRSVADRLDDGAVTLRSGGEEFTVNPPETVEFEVKVEREGAETSLELELEWTDGANEGGGGDFEVA
ncbi:amphi-Trp domain-containing protein [Salarchaeum sp. III]|uniref:amphi-Trp domain-containing protein n=1 Tax=Salarchaeum sp. III TaxID=3107927 RepID=UPI002EDB50C7